MNDDHTECNSELKNLKIDPALHWRLKIEAAGRGLSLQAVTEAALVAGLDGGPQAVADTGEALTVKVDPMLAPLLDQYIALKALPSRAAAVEALLRQALTGTLGRLPPRLAGF